MDTEKKDRILHLETQITTKTDAPPEPVVDTAPVQADDDEEVVEAAAPDEGEEDSEAPAPSHGEDSAAHPKKKNGAKKRIHELTREKHEERRAREALEQEVMYYRQQSAMQQPQAQQPQAQPMQPQGKPTLEAYGYDTEAYESARDQWVIEQAKSSWQQEQQRTQYQQQQQERATQVKTRIQAFEAEVPGGWEAAISAPIDYTPTMLEAIAESEIGPKVGYYLSQNLDEALQLSQLPPFKQAVAMGRIEAKLLSAPSSRPPATVTRAPAPASTISATSPSSKTEDQKSIDEMIDEMRAKKRR